MKQFFLLFAATAVNLTMYAQNTFPSSGNVGIGTTTPITKLHIVESATAGSYFKPLMIYNPNLSTGQHVQIAFGKANSTYNQAEFNFNLEGGAGSSNNSFSLGLYGNPTIMTLKGTGNVGIGTNSPTQKLHVVGNQLLSGNLHFANSLQSIQFANPGPSSNAMMYMFSSGTTNADRMVIGHSTAFPTWGLQYSDAADRFDFLGGGSSKLSINLGSGNIGIGTNSPGYLLDVAGRIRLRSGSGGTAGVWLNNVANSALTGFMGVLNDNTMGFYGAASGWSLLINTTNGFVGVRNSTPSTELHIRHGINSGITNGLRIQNEGTNNNEWTFYVQNSNGDLELYKNGAIRGRFNNTSGTYSAASDERLKMKIEKAEAVMENIMKLGVKRYQFKEGQKDNRRYYGMLAQEVEKVFPDVVFHPNGDDGKDYYTMDYSAMGVLAIKGLQELKPEVDKQQEQITQLQLQNETLQQELIELKNMLARITGDRNLLPIKKGTLSLASPNPVKATARIQYELPQGTSNARLHVTDALGRTVKILQLTSAGTVNLDVSALSSGVYHYTLVADGKTLQTRKLTVEK